MKLFHVVSRGVDRRKIFLDKSDYYRFIHDLFEFNDLAPALNIHYSFGKIMKSSDLRGRYLGEKREPRKLLVRVHAFCLMPNHYHLLLSPVAENGITSFMRKLNAGYAKYFNEKNEREGTLFQGRFKSVPIATQAHLNHILYYIHCNALDLFAPEWRNRERKKSPKGLMQLLDSYRWSSHGDYMGVKNFPSVTQRHFFLEYFEGSTGYSNSMEDWLKDFDFKREYEKAGGKKRWNIFLEDQN